MHITLLDERGCGLSDMTSHFGKPGQLLMDWAARPDALFQYYFDRDGRVVTVVHGAARYAAILGTRWQMGTRFWYLTVRTAQKSSGVRRPIPLRNATLDPAGARRGHPHPVLPPTAAASSRRRPAPVGVPA